MQNILKNYFVTESVYLYHCFEIALLTKGTSDDGDFDVFLQVVLEKKKTIHVRPFQSLGHSFEKINYLNNYYSNLKNVLSSKCP